MLVYHKEEEFRKMVEEAGCDSYSFDFDKDNKLRKSMHTLGNVALCALLFCFKSLSSRLLIGYLRRFPAKLSIFRSLEKRARKIARTEAAIDFLNVCVSFDLCPAFARLDKSHQSKWSYSSSEFTARCLR